MSKLIPKYTMWEAVNAAIAVGMRALEEIRTLARTPGPQGPAGRDGFGFDDMDLDVREDGTFLRFTRGDVVKEFRIAGAYRGVFKDGVYRVGDSVSFGGSQFIAERETSAKPETPDSGWRLAVKRGRDGKDGELKAPIKVGPVKAG